MSQKRGFTLIELLVVIAIIGILASVVLTSLGSARTKGRDASAKGSMTSMRAEAELGVSNAGLYLADLCLPATTGTGSLGTLIAAVNENAGDVVCGQNAAATVAPSAWGAVVDLNDGTLFCVDSTGYSGVSTAADKATEITDGAAGDVVCDNQ